MRLFSLIDFQYWVLSFALGLVAAILVYIAWGSYPIHRKDRTTDEIRSLEGHEIDSGHKAQKVPIAPFLIFVYVGVVVWSIAYMIYTGIMRGVSF
jgi:hypothetical protein